MTNEPEAPRRAEVVPVRNNFPLIEDPRAMKNAIGLLDENLGNPRFVLKLSRIKVPAGGSQEPKFEVQTAAGWENTGVIIGVITSYRQARGYWKEKNVTGRPPDCSSTDGFIGQGELEVKPKGWPYCTECEFAKFKSARNPDGTPGPGQACKEVRQVLLLMPGNYLPHMLSIPPTSLDSFLRYSISLNTSGQPYWAVTTRMTLSPATSQSGQKHARINFAMYSRLREDQIAALEPYHERMHQFLKPTPVDATAYEIVEAEAEPAIAKPGEHPFPDDDVPF